jgi:fimbrial chaperone protein
MKMMTIVSGRIVAISALTFSLCVLLGAGASQAQSLTVLPVNIEMAPGQLATTLTVINHGDSETSVQIRALDWNQPEGAEQLTPSSLVVASPPIATIAPGATQIVRLVLRQPPKEREATYRILLDQIPPPASPGTVRIALRLSIPVFAQPVIRALPHVEYHIENDAGQAYLVALNDGGRHDTIRDIVLTTTSGNGLTTTANASPYILAGATRRWLIDAQNHPLTSGETLHLTGKADTGPVDQPVPVIAH